MTYPWCNERRLATLLASGDAGVLNFTTPDEDAKIHLDAEGIAKVVFTAKGRAPVEIPRAAAEALVVGEGNATRDVYHFLKPGGPAPTMRIGITKHRGRGTWSSLPHDFELSTEPGFEEVFFYLLEGGPKRALQLGRGVWHDNSAVDAVWPVEDHSFATVPMGYHPVVGEPGTHVSYVWVYLAKHARWEKVK
jgi:5-deoxy-D-glucuronate isomerase